VSVVAAFFMACSSGAVGLELLNRMDLVLSNLSYPEHLIGTGFAANSQISDRMARKRRYDQSGTLRGDDFEFSAFATKRLSQVVSTDSFVYLHLESPSLVDYSPSTIAAKVMRPLAEPILLRSRDFR